jgi:hypothetical protein
MLRLNAPNPHRNSLPYGATGLHIIYQGLDSDTQFCRFFLLTFENCVGFCVSWYIALYRKKCKSFCLLPYLSRLDTVFAQRNPKFVPCALLMPTVVWKVTWRRFSFVTYSDFPPAVFILLNHCSWPRSPIQPTGNPQLINFRPSFSVDVEQRNS